MEGEIVAGHIENEGIQKRHRQRFLRKKRLDVTMRSVQRGEMDAMHMHLRDSQQLDCRSLILIATHAQPYTRLPARAGYHRCGWNASCLSCSFFFTRQTSLPSHSIHVIMADPTLDAPEVPILLLGDAEVGKSTFLS